jgi:prepilin-type N-terminal cleavage/methylation domain-containing protein
MESIKSILKNKKGFTLVEMLVSIALFGIISVALINVFVASIKSQSRIIYSQELLEQSSYVLEYMNSKIRMAIKDVDGSCITIGSTYNIYGGGSSIRFISYNAEISDYVCREFFLENNSIKERSSTDTSSSNFSVASVIASPSFKVNSLKFSIFGDSIGNQPRVTTLINMHKEEQDGVTSKITIQSTASKRQLEI